MEFIDNREEMNTVPLENISFPKSFFREEVRNGFYIPTMIKRYWAGQLQILSEIHKLCKKHNIKWFADYGTLLGAVRHGGYIPWDDDFDICMMRDDYERFFEIAKKEFPKEYIILLLRDYEEYDNALGRIVNCHSIDCSKDHMDMFSGCPYTVGVDIFPLDGMYRDEAKEKERVERLKRAVIAHDAVAMQNDLGELAKNIELLILGVEKDNHVKLKRGKKLKHELEKLIEKIYMECPVSEADKVALMPFYFMYGDHVYPKEFYNDAFDMKFENTTVKVPCCYDQKLSSDYGNYMEIRKGGGMHEYPAYVSQERALRKKLGNNPYTYTFDPNEMLVSVKRYMVRTLSQRSEKEKKKVVFLPCRAQWWNTMEGLWYDYKTKGHDVHVVPINFYDCDYFGGVGEMHDERSLFPKYLDVEDCETFDFVEDRPDVIVIQVPYDAYNTALTVHELFYSKSLLNVTDELVYVPCFDIDDPIDSEDKACRGIEILAEQSAVVNSDKVLLKSEKQRELYLKRLIELAGEETRAYWEQKIQVSPLVGADWRERADIDASGAIQAAIDEEAAKDAETLDSEWNEFLGEYKGRKAVVYYFGISTFMQHKDKAVDKFERVLETFEESSDKVVAVFVPQDYLTANIDIADPKLVERYNAFVKKVKETKGCIFDEENRSLKFVEKWSGYYGDTGVVAMDCLGKHIPVMLQNINI